jgi:two-component system chemotaxis response regulator CheY
MMSTKLNWSSLRFLVVDDERLVRTVVVRILQSFGCVDIAEAGSAEDALPHLTGQVKTPHCVILDIKMAPVNGIELALMIRSDPRINRHDVPIIMLTGHAEESLVKAAMLLDVNGFVLKPVSRAMLASRIQFALRSGPRIDSRRTYRKRLGAIEAPAKNALAGQ